MHMHVCVCVLWSIPLDAMKSQNLQTCFKATIPSSPCPSPYLGSITWVTPRQVHGIVPGVLWALVTMAISVVIFACN